ncbi:hypothetical protein FRB98_006245 [Tulasnella sp. 332]|nr:hypothetical protein FRB98_006245 [Tulasnella sp. 332]
MRTSTLTFAAFGLYVSRVFGHGQVHKIITATTTYIAADAYAAADPTSPIRKLNTYGPAADMLGEDIVCGPGGNTPVNNTAVVAAGSQVTFDWTTWSSVHPGFKGDTGNIWVKIDQDGYVSTRTPQPWAEETLRVETEQTYTITIPASLANGEYLLRHEILGLHVASTLNGAQFYPNCLQITVTGGGSANPTGVALPGAYQPTDPSILTQLYWYTPSNTSASYVIPGGPVVLDGSSPNRYGSGPPVQTGGSQPTSTPATTAKPTTTASTPTTAKTTTTSAAPTGPTVPEYGQCGGAGWTGGTVCASPYTCKVSNAYYSQCL